MKKPVPLKCALLAISFLIIAAVKAEAQRLPDKLNINIQSNFFITNNDYGGSETYFFAFNPGSEVLCEIGLTKTVSFSPGFSYVYSEWYHSIGVKSHFKRQAHELFVPVLVNVKTSSGIYFSGGIYPGWLAKGKQLYKNEMDIRNWIDNTKYTNYDSSQKFSADVFLGAGYNQYLDAKHSIHFFPFAKFKITDNWMGEVRSRMSFGLTFQYSFQF